MSDVEGKYTIRLKDVDKTLGKVKRIDCINMETEQGKIYGLIGPNGAGKTTLFNLITGLYKPDNGTIRVVGLDPVRDYKETRRQIGLLPHKAQLFIRNFQQEKTCVFMPLCIFRKCKRT